MLKSNLKTCDVVNFQEVNFFQTNIGANTNTKFYFQWKLQVISDNKSKFSYHILISNKSQKPLIQQYWSRKFELL